MSVSKYTTMRIQLVSGLSLILFYSSYLNIENSLASAQCLDHQRSLLLQLKNDLTFQLWNQSFEADCCNWKGVFCDKEGHVTGLDLSLKFISTELDNSSSLFSLRDLQNLNLAYNNFNSVIPSAFEKLTNLSYLNLSNAGFVGQIPIEISHLTRLVVLDISNLFWSGIHDLKLENPNLVMFVQNLTQVRELYLDGIIISDKGNEWCNALSSSLPDLQVLSMSRCNLSGPIVSFQTLKNLSVIRLDHNILSAPVPEFFAKFSNLTILHLSFCGLNGSFPQDVFKVQTLTSVDLSYNNDLHGSLPDFPQNGSLLRLILSSTNFSGALPDSIGNLRKLSRLECNRCHFNGILPDSISTLKELTYLDLSSNYFRGSFPSFGNAKKLTHMDISSNDLRGPISSAHFERLQNLVSINLEWNYLNGSIPSSLFALPSLQEIRLSFNQFDGQLDELSNLSNSPLETIDLGGNNLEGPIPKSIFHLNNLQMLLLSSNKFNGTVHLDMIRSLKNLTVLDLSHNNLSVDANITEADLYSLPNITNLGLASCNLRTFPVFLRNQSMLNILDLSNNQIQGKIPNWIWKFDFLIELNLSSNLLTGLEGPLRNPKPNLLILDLHSNEFHGQLVFPPNVTHLDYSNNKFNSVNPHDTFGLPWIKFLSLSNNDLQGSIPDSFCNASNLWYLDLSYNKFHGTIPQCLTELDHLIVLNVRDNMLNGSIPDTFSESCFLEILDLHGNQLGGSLPKSVANCAKLEVLDLGKNQIFDFFPCWLGNISTLRVLVLQNNKFYGPIRCPKMEGSWQLLQIVDLSFNNFRDRLPYLLFTTWKAMMPHEDKAVIKVEDMVFRYLGIYYHHLVTVKMKGQELQLVKILYPFISIDFSSNHFDGPIPEELMNLQALIVINLSNNSLSDQIPSSIGNLRQLESLDLSNNLLDGEIPPELANLNFLSFLNLSFNNLEGKIPTGTQIQSFEATSFEGNEDLCGPPLTKNCSRDVEVKSNSTNESSFSWNFISSELGFTFGIGMIFLPLLFWKRWRVWYWKFADDILYRIFPQLDYVHECHGGKNYRTLRWKSH